MLRCPDSMPVMPGTLAGDGFTYHGLGEKNGESK